jgi:hypothetical protein
MQVFQLNEDRPVSSRSYKELQYGPKQEGTQLLGLSFEGTRYVGEYPSELRYQAGHLCGVGTQGLFKAGRVLRQRRLENFDDRAKRNSVLSIVAITPQHSETSFGGLDARLDCQTGFPNARSATDQHHSWSSAKRLFERLA